jgi:hypothetical protein
MQDSDGRERVPRAVRPYSLLVADQVPGGRSPVPRGADDAGARGRTGLEPFRRYRLAARLAQTVGTRCDPLGGDVEVRQPRTGLLKEGCNLRSFECDGLALRVVLVVGRHSRPRLSDLTQILGKRLDVGESVFARGHESLRDRSATVGVVCAG